MKWREKITFGMLIVSMLFSTAVLGRNLWMQEKEQIKFEILRNRISAERERSSATAEVKRTGDKMIKSLNEGKRTVLPEYQEIAKENPNFAGWVSIEGTCIDYPVMQTPCEPEYYIHRNLAREYSYAGVPFVGTGDLKAENGDIFIYGHNMRNGTMFADLLKYQKKEFWREHPVISLDTLWEHQNFEVFAVFYVNEREWTHEDGKIYQILHKSGVSKLEAIHTLKMTGEYDTGITLEMDSRFLYLVTCAYRENGNRFVVAGMLKT